MMDVAFQTAEHHATFWSFLGFGIALSDFSLRIHCLAPGFQKNPKPAEYPPMKNTKTLSAVP